MNLELIHPMDDRYFRFLSDESKEVGFADSISFPSSADELKQIITLLPPAPITIQGSNTGIEGKAVPHGGHIINFSKMKQIFAIEQTSENEGYAIVEPGVSLQELTAALQKKFKNSAFIWAPSPTETSASIGGVIASNAYGMNSYYYGAESPYVDELTILKQNGQKEILTEFSHPLTLPTGSFIIKARLKLLKRSPEIFGAVFFFPEEEKAWACADALQVYQPSHAGAQIISMEYIGKTALLLTENSRDQISGLKNIPAIPTGAQAVIYVEIGGKSEAQDSVIMELMELTMNYGCDPDLSWALSGYAETQKMHLYRHAVTESVIQYIEKRHMEDPRICKICAKSKGKHIPFKKYISSVQEKLQQEDLASSVYAHVKDSDLSVDFLPKNYEEYLRCVTIADKLV